MPKPSSKPSGKRLLTAQRLVDITLELIEQEGGSRGVNLRQVAARAKCAHPSIYNYFDSLDDLLWASVAHALDLHVTQVAERLRSVTDWDVRLRTFLEIQVDLVLAHPSFYRVFWMEPFAGPPPPLILQHLGTLREMWASFTIRTEEAARSHMTREWPGPVVHSFFHGELCKLIGPQSFVPNASEARDRIVRTTLRLIKLLEQSGAAIRA